MTPRRLLAALAGALALGDTGACAQVLDIDQDRVPKPEGSDARWSCLQPGAVEGSVAKREVRVLAIDLLNASSFEVLQMPRVKEANVKACKPLGAATECTPLSAESAAATTDGQAVVNLSGSFDGYLEVKPTDEGAFTPRLTYDDRLRTNTGFGNADQESGYIFAYLFAKAAWQGGATGIFGTPQDADRGFLYAEIYDCNGAFANNVSFKLSVDPLDAKVQSFYTAAGGLPATGLTETQANRGGGFFNVPAGEYVLTVTDNVSGFTLTRAVAIRSGWDTNLFVGPYRTGATPPGLARGPRLR